MGSTGAESYEILDKWLINGSDLFTVQLSENCSDLTNFREDSRSLFKHISTVYPTAQIIVVDAFWNDEKHEIKINLERVWNLFCRSQRYSEYGRI